MEPLEDDSTAVFLARDPDVVRARRVAIDLGRQGGLSERDLARLDVVVSELATNVVRHAGRGRVSFRPADGARPGLEVHCCDDGPGPDFTEGPSSRGLGLGLATARELADSLAIRHEPGSGMCVRAVVLA